MMENLILPEELEFLSKKQLLVEVNNRMNAMCELTAKIGPVKSCDSVYFEYVNQIQRHREEIDILLQKYSMK